VNYSPVTEPYMVDIVVRGESDPIFSDFLPHAPSTGDHICMGKEDYRVLEIEWVILRDKFSGAIVHVEPITGFGN
jgi:hypothetical protein